MNSKETKDQRLSDLSLNVRTTIQIQDCLILFCYTVSFLCFGKEKTLKEFWVAERALKTTT